LDIPLGIVGGLGAGLCWATTSVLVRSLSGTLSPGTLNALRSLTGGGLLLSLCLFRGEVSEILATPLWALLSFWASIVLGQVIGDTLFFRSIGYLGVTSALTIGISNPILTALAGMLLFSEVAHISHGIGIGLVIVGVFGIIREGGERRLHPLVARQFNHGLCLGGIAALTWAASALLLKAPLRVVPALTATAVRLPVGGLTLLLTPWTRGAWGEVERGLRTETLRMTAICLLGAVGPLCYTVGIKHGGVALGGALSATAPLFSVLLELLCFEKWPSRQTIIGAAVTVLGILVLRIP
jgi:drug/metabolite transporter (DMT)-like permease